VRTELCFYVPRLQALLLAYLLDSWQNAEASHSG
jgi:hypothetical protein